MLRIMKVVLIGTVALWGFVGLLQNVVDLSGTAGAVSAATSMTTFESDSENWQATSNPIVVWVGALFIMFSKAITGVLCSIGAIQMWGARHEDSATFTKSKELALVGCAVALTMLFGGFIVIAETWFELWRSDAMRGPVLDSAFRYAGTIALIAIFIGARDD